MLKTILRRSACALAALLVLPFCSGCDTDDELKMEDVERFFGDFQPKEARYVLTFAGIVKYPRGNTSLEKSLNTVDGKRVVIEAVPYMSSANIIQITAQPIPDRPGYYKLRLRPDQRGRTMWLQLSVQFQHTPIALLIDGIYYADFIPPRIPKDDETWIDLPVEMDQVMAEYVVKYANDNYKYYNSGKIRQEE